jgi:Tfp pilus assembly protein PilF
VIPGKRKRLFRTPIAIALLAAMLFGAPAWAASEPPPPFRAPYLPTNDAKALQAVPKRDNPVVRKMYALRKKLTAHPRDKKTALKLAQLYVAFGRSIGDAHFAGYAEAAIAPWMKQKPPAPKVLIMHATILQYLHKFRRAEKELKSALARDPADANGWLTLAFTELIQGQYKRVNRSCVQLTNHGGPFLGAICSATLRSYTGHAKQAYAMLAMDQATSPKEPAAVKAWIQGLLAECAVRLGRTKKADAHFRKALSYTPHDNFLLVNYSDFLLDHGRAKKVIKLLGTFQQSDTQFLRIALAEQALKSPALGRFRWDMTARFAALAQRGDTIYQREHARFVLSMQHDPARALKLAERNWRLQRAFKDVRVYLEAALAAGKPEAAKPVLEFLAKNKMQGPVIEGLAKKARRQLHKKEVARQ